MSGDKYTKRLKQQLDSSGAILTRQRKHRVWKLPSGQNLVTSATPSDWRQSRRAAADLRRLLAGEPEVPFQGAEPVLPPDVPAPPGRFIVPNRPPRSKGAVQLPKLEPEGRGTERGPLDLDLCLMYKNDGTAMMDDSFLDFPAFWHLSPCGRTRVLRTLLGHGRRVDVVGIMFCRGPRGEICRLVGESKPEIIQRMLQTTGGQYYRALMVHEADGTAHLVDPCSHPLLGGGDILVVADVEPDLVDGSRLLLAVPLGDDEAIAMWPRPAKHAPFPLVTDAAWTNPTIWRPVWRELEARAEASAGPSRSAKGKNVEGHSREAGA